MFNFSELKNKEVIINKSVVEGNELPKITARKAVKATARPQAKRIAV